VPSFGLIFRTLECAPVQNNSFPVCLFPECFSEVKYVMLLPEQTGNVLLCLWRLYNEIRKKITITTCEETVQALFQL
jgi:hypothetical protein